MRVMFAVAVLLSGIACIGEAEAQACDRDCNRCLVYARGECVKRGADPACEARRKKCLERRTGAPKSTTTTAPLPTVRQRQQQIQQQGRPQMPAPTVVPPAPKSVPTVVAPAPKSVPTVIAPAPKSVPTVIAPAPKSAPTVVAPKSAPTVVAPAPTVVPPVPRLVPALIYLRAADIPPH